jgi:hypothetical protein
MSKFLRNLNQTAKFGGPNRALMSRKASVHWETIQRIVQCEIEPSPCEPDTCHDIDYTFGCESKVDDDNPMRTIHCVTPCEVPEELPVEESEVFCDAGVAEETAPEPRQVIAPVRCVYDVFRDTRRKLWRDRLAEIAMTMPPPLPPIEEPVSVTQVPE